MLTADKFWKWVDDRLPQGPSPKTISIDAALGGCKVFSNLANRVAELEKKLDLKNTNE